MKMIQVNETTWVPAQSVAWIQAGPDAVYIHLVGTVREQRAHAPKEDGDEEDLKVRRKAWAFVEVNRLARWMADSTRLSFEFSSSLPVLKTASPDSCAHVREDA